MANSVVWLDIPVMDLDRAIKFYSAVLGTAVKKEEFTGMSIGVFHHGGSDVGGCLVKSEKEKPGVSGPLVYLNAQGRLDEVLAAIPGLGGSVVQPKHAIGPHGFRAVVIDSEGNRVALHSM